MISHLLTSLKLALAFPLGFVLFSSPASAHDGTNSSGGGDSCEARIQEIRDDITKWINLGGPENTQLQLPAGIDLATYKRRMNEALAVRIDSRGHKQAQVDIECTHQPLMVETTEKVCRFDRYKDGGAKIRCYFDAFLDQKTMSQARQYKLVHHEYAQIAGFEPASGAQSDYEISEQIASRLRADVRMKLYVGDSGDASYVCFSIPETREQFVCTETEMRAALAIVRAAQAEARNAKLPLSGYVRKIAKGAIYVGGGVALTGGALIAANLLWGAYINEIGQLGIAAIVVGAPVAAIGGITLVLTPSETARSSWTEILSSVDGLGEALPKMTDDHVLAFARQSPAVAQTIMATAGVILKASGK